MSKIPNEETYPDLHHKLSKKIAQLTRVIFHLNTKNDEYEYNLRAIVGAYECEFDNLVREANSSITKYKDSIAKLQKNEELEAYIKNLQDKIELDKSKSINEFSQYKRQMEEREQKFTKEYNGKLDAYRNECEMLRGKYEGMLKNVEKLINNSSDLTKSHKKEMADYVAEQNQKYNELLKQKLDLEDVVKEKNKIIDTLKRDLDKLQEKSSQDLRFLKASNDKGLNEANSKLSDLEKAKSLLELKVKDLENIDKENKRRINELQSELALKTKELDSFSSSTDKQKGEISGLLSKNKSLEEELAKARNEISAEKSKSMAFQGKISQLEDRIRTLEAEKAGLLKDLQRNIESFGQKEADFASQKNKLSKEIESLTAQIEGLKNNSQDLLATKSGELAEKQKEIEGLKKLLQKKDLEIDEEKSRRKEIVAQYKEEIKKMKEGFDEEIRKNNETLDARVMSFKLQQEEKIKEIMRENESTLQQIEKKHEKSMLELRKQYETQLKEMKQEYENLLQSKSQKETSLQKELENMKERLEKTTKELEKAIKDLKNLDNLRLSLEEENQAKSLEISQLNASLQNISEENQRLRSLGVKEVERLKLENDALRKELEAQALNFEQRLYKEKTEYESTIKSTLKHMKDDHLFELRRLKEDYELEKSLLETEKNKRIREIENELSSEKKRHVDDNTEWAMKLDSEKKDHEEKIAEILRKHAAELEEKEQEFSSFIAKLKKTHAQELQAVEQKRMEEKQEALKELLDRKNLELEESKKLFEKKYQRLSKSFDAQLVEKTKEFEARMQDKDGRLNAELKAHQETKNEFLKYKDENETKIKKLEETIKNMRRFQFGLEEEIKELKEEAVRIRAQHENELDKVTDEKIKMQKNLQDREAELKERLKHELANQIKSHMKFVEDLKTEYYEMEHLGQEKFRELNDKYEDLKMLFDQRPSRVEDIETIKMLKKEIFLREEEIRKLNENMKFFKLELINREQNYNKMFNANPHIGVFNPLENKTSFVTNSAGGTGQGNSQGIQRLGSSGAGGVTNIAAGAGGSSNSNTQLPIGGKSFKSINKI